MVTPGQASVISSGDYYNDLLMGLPASIIFLLKFILFIASNILKIKTTPIGL